jgi:hypothetical protein
MDILNTIQSGLGGEKKNDLLTGISEILADRAACKTLSASLMQKDWEM